MNTENTSGKVRKLTGMALFTAIVVILQFLGSVIRLGTFSVSLVLVPIVVGAAMYGMGAGAYLGAVFGAVVLISGDAALFMTVNPAGTILTVLLKGALAGFASGGVYRLVEKKNRYLAVLAAAAVCPIVNTGVFLLGCFLFFMGKIAEMAAGMGLGDNVVRFMFTGLVGWNFVFELGVDVVVSHVILRIIDEGKKHRSGE